MSKKHSQMTRIDTVEKGGTKEGAPKLLMRNASVMPVQTSENFTYGDLIRGQIKASGNGTISIEHCQMAPVTLITKDNGAIELQDIKMLGAEPKLMPQGGPIRFLDLRDVISFTEMLQVLCDKAIPSLPLSGPGMWRKGLTFVNRLGF